MNTPLGKQTLALARGADYAHPGEEEAIVHAFRNVLPNRHRQVLDAGCGPGGTAEQVQKNGFGLVTGIDIDQITLKLASEKYPRCRFLYCDVENVENHFGEEFGLVYMFTSFYAFPDQPKALMALRKVSEIGAVLLLFDYCLGFSSRGVHDIRREEAGRFNPVDKTGIGGMLELSGWKMQSCEDITDKFHGWYARLIMAVRNHEAEIRNLGGEEWFRFVLDFYSRMYKALEENRLGGCLVLASAV